MTRIRFNWTCEYDLDGILAIESVSFDQPLSREDLRQILQRPNCIGTTVKVGKKVVGYVIHGYSKKFGQAYIEILRLAVHPDWRRRGVGHAMVARLKSKLAKVPHHRRLIINVRERDLTAQLFFRAVGIRADMVLPGHYADTSEDAYRFSYRLPADESAVAVIT